MANFPNMSDGIAEWLTPITFERIVKTVVNFQAVETKTEVRLQGVMYSQTGQQLISKPEGQRKWNWWSLVTAYDFNIDDIVIDDQGLEYRVVKKNDYSRAGFYEYELAQGWAD
jgi:hypothetical protein